MADELGMGKTIEKGLVLKALKLRGIIKGVLIIVQKSTLLQWQQEMKKHFNEPSNPLIVKRFMGYVYLGQNGLPMFYSKNKTLTNIMFARVSGL